MTQTTTLNDLPVVIDGPGEYVTRAGARATIREIGPQAPDTTSFAAKGSLWRMFRGRVRPRGLEIWHVSGRSMPLDETRNDIVGRFDGIERP